VKSIVEEEQRVVSRTKRGDFDQGRRTILVGIQNQETKRHKSNFFVRLKF
jgi:hypothetical protein